MSKEAGAAPCYRDALDREAVPAIALLGKLCGVEQEAKALAAELTGRVDKVVQMTASREKPLVFLQINLQPIMTVNNRTIHHDLIQLAGGKEEKDKALDIGVFELGILEAYCMSQVAN